MTDTKITCAECGQTFNGASAKKSLTRHIKTKHSDACTVCGDPMVNDGVQTVDGVVHATCKQDDDLGDPNVTPHFAVVNVDEDPEVPGRWHVSVGFDDLGFIEGENEAAATRRGNDEATARLEARASMLDIIATAKARTDARADHVTSNKVAERMMAAADEPVDEAGPYVNDDHDPIVGETLVLPDGTVEATAYPTDVVAEDTHGAVVMLTVEEHSALMRAAKDEWTGRREAVRSAREGGQPEPPEGPSEQRLRRWIEGGRIIMTTTTKTRRNGEGSTRGSAVRSTLRYVKNGRRIADGGNRLSSMAFHFTKGIDPKNDKLTVDELRVLLTKKHGITDLSEPWGPVTLSNGVTLQLVDEANGLWVNEAKPKSSTSKPKTATTKTPATNGAKPKAAASKATVEAARVTAAKKMGRPVGAAPQPAKKTPTTKALAALLPKAPAKGQPASARKAAAKQVTPRPKASAKK